MARRVTWTNNSTSYDGTEAYRDTTIDPQNLPEPIATVDPVAQGATVEYIDTTGSGDQCYAVRDFDAQGVGEVSEGYCFEVPSSTIEARYWRVHITDTESGSAIRAQLAEVELRSQSGTPSSPSGGTAIGSGFFGSGSEFDKAFDGDPSTAWASPDDSSLPHWVGYDFGSPHPVEQLMLQAGDSATRAERAPIDFTLDYSDDGIQWTVLASIYDDPSWSAGEERTYDISAPNPPFAHWRILVTASNSGDSFEAGVAELQFRQSAGQSESHTGGTPFASSDAAAGFEAAQAFDGDPDTLWVSASGAALPQHVGYTFSTAREVDEIYLQAGDTQARADRCPTAFTLQGSHDGSVWFAVDAYSGISAWSIGESRTFSVG